MRGHTRLNAPRRAEKSAYIYVISPLTVSPSLRFPTYRLIAGVEAEYAVCPIGGQSISGGYGEIAEIRPPQASTRLLPGAPVSTWRRMANSDRRRVGPGAQAPRKTHNAAGRRFLSRSAPTPPTRQYPVGRQKPGDQKQGRAPDSPQAAAGDVANFKNAGPPP